MLILTLRTDNPEAEIGLYQDNKKLAYQKWQAHRQLAETLHTTIKSLLKEAGKDWSDLQGVVVFQGPGSFTGLRIGISVANALAYAESIPIVAADGAQWQSEGITRLLQNQTDTVVLPEYGAPVHITIQKR